ncbi:MAG: chemotaxis protein CheC [Halobacteriaceae archaeon]
MQVDIQALGTYNSLAREGAGRAAESLSMLTGVETSVDVTRLSLAKSADLQQTLSEWDMTGVHIGFDGGLAGDALLVFEQGTADHLLGEVLPRLLDRDSVGREGITEVGNIVTSGFLDGWADYLGTTIDIEPPEYVGPARAAELVQSEDAAVAGEHLFAFESHLGALDEDVSFHLYLLPERESFARLLREGDGDGAAVDVEKLSTFNRLAAKGAEGASETMTTMTGMDTAVDVSRLSFVPIEDAPSHVGDDRYVGVVLELDGTPSGYVAILFDEPSARNIAAALLPTEPDDAFEGMTRSALEEIGNVMTSGFIDGWANVLETTIDHSPPSFVHDMGSALVDPIAARLGRTQEHAFIVDTVIRTDDREVGCDIYVLPEADELSAALRSIEADQPLDTEPRSFAGMKNGEM